MAIQYFYTQADVDAVTVPKTVIAVSASDPNNTLGMDYFLVATGSDYKSNAVVPNIAGFLSGLEGVFGGIGGVNTVIMQLPAFYPAIEAQDWADVATLITSTKNGNLITAAQYTAIQALVASNNIPVVLP